MTLYQKVAGVISRMEDLTDAEAISEIVAAIEPSEEKLRDRFAMAALTGILASDPGFLLSEEKAAGCAYKQADAMLAARKVKP
jgi:hypothetical protein